MKKHRKLLLIATAAVVLLISWPVILHYQAKARLAAYKKELLAKGEKLEISDFAPAVNEQARENAITLLNEANSLVRVIDFLPNGMKEVKPGRARVAWCQAELNQEVDYKSVSITNVWPFLRNAQTQNSNALTIIRKLVADPKIEFPIDYQSADFPSSLSTYLIATKSLALTVGAEVILDLRDGRTNEALENLLLGAEVPELFAGVPLDINQLVRYAMIAMMVAPTWESLQYKGWTDAQFGQLQKRWESIDVLTGAISSFGMERAREPMFFKAGRKSKENLAAGMNGITPSPNFGELLQEAVESPKEGLKDLFNKLASYPRYYVWKWIWSYDDERLNMQLTEEAFDKLRAAKRGEAVPYPANGGRMDFWPILLLGSNLSNSKYPVTAMEETLIQSFIPSLLRAQTQVEILITAIALERYHLRHYKYPASLEELIPSLLKRIPEDYMDGNHLRYRLNGDGTFLLYSVGYDRTDDGGDPRPLGNRPVGFLYGRDWVWPSAATEQEVKEFEAAEAEKAVTSVASRKERGRLRNSTK